MNIIHTSNKMQSQTADFSHGAAMANSTKQLSDVRLLPPPDEMDERYALSLILAYSSIMWKHDVTRST